MSRQWHFRYAVPCRRVMAEKSEGRALPRVKADTAWAKGARRPGGRVRRAYCGLAAVERRPGEQSQRKKANRQTDKQETGRERGENGKNKGGARQLLRNRARPWAGRRLRPGNRAPARFLPAQLWRGFRAVRQSSRRAQARCGKRLKRAGRLNPVSCGAPGGTGPSGRRIHAAAALPG